MERRACLFRYDLDHDSASDRFRDVLWGIRPGFGVSARYDPHGLRKWSLDGQPKLAHVHFTGFMAMGQNPVPPVNISIPTQID